MDHLDFKDNKKFAFGKAINYFVCYFILSSIVLIVLWFSLDKLLPYLLVWDFYKWLPLSTLFILLFNTRYKYKTIKYSLDISTQIERFKENNSTKGQLKSKINEYTKYIDRQKTKLDLFKTYSPIPILISIIGFYLGAKDNEIPSFDSPKTIFIAIALVVTFLYFIFLYKSWRRFGFLHTCLNQYQKAYDKLYEN